MASNETASVEAQVERKLPNEPAHHQSWHTYRPVKIWGIRLGFLVIILGIWQLSAIQEWINPLFTSSPSAIWNALLQNGWTVIKNDLPTTLLETFFGLILGSVVGFIAGVIFARNELLNTAMRPIYVALNSLPRIALAPLFILWFGLGMPSKIALSFTLVVFIVMINTIVGLTQVDRDMAMLAQSMGIKGARQLRIFLLPAAVPMLAAALELGIVYSFLGAVTAELIGGSRGLGVQLELEANSFQTANFFATLLILASVTTAITILMRIVTKRMLRWHYIEMKGMT